MDTADRPRLVQGAGVIKATPDTRSKKQKAISQGLKFAWKRKRAAGGWHAKTPEATEAQLHRAVADFLAALDKYFAGARDPATLARLT